MPDWPTIPASERASVVEMTRQAPRVPFPSITVALPAVKAWALARGVTWDPHDHIRLADAYLVAQYGASTNRKEANHGS